MMQATQAQAGTSILRQIDYRDHQKIEYRMRQKALWCYLGVGWSNVISHGSSETDASQRTSKKLSHLPQHGSLSLMSAEY